MVGFLAIALFGAARSTLWDRDEPRFAQAASEMLGNGRLLFPTFNGRLRPDKPILPYWTMAGAMRIFGRRELAARLPSVLAAGGAILATAETASVLAGPAAAPWAAAVLAASPLFLVESVAATADATLLFFVTLAFSAFATMTVRGPRPGTAALLAAAVAGALYAKGPVGLVLPLLGVAGTLAAGRGIPSRARLALVASAAFALAAGLFAAWFVPANAATGGAYFREGFGRHVVARAIHPMDGHGGTSPLSLLFYVPVVLLGFSPWLLHLPAAGIETRRGTIGGPAGRALLLGWTVPGFLFFSLVATKLPHYALPLLPPAAVAVGATIARAGEREGTRAGAAGLALFAPVAAGEAILLGAAAARLPAPLPGLAAALALLVAATASAAILRWRARDVRGSAAILAAGMAAGALLTAALVLPALERFKPAPRIARAIRAATPAQARVATLAFPEPSLDFYLDRPPIERLGGSPDVARWAARPGPGVLVATREALLAVPELRSLPLSLLTTASGFDYVKGRRVDLYALARAGP